MKALEESHQNLCPAACILIADDVAEWRDRARRILEKQPEWRIVAEACDGAQAVERAEELSPDLVLLDIGMPVLNGLEAARQIQRILPRSRIVFLTQESDADIRIAALDAGGHGYVVKADAASELIPTITAALMQRTLTYFAAPAAEWVGTPGFLKA
jgi:DNA-binding NarL/FixJ family response regulator